MEANEYHRRIEDYYAQTENAYKDSWDLDRSLAIHYGYWDERVHSFSQSLVRMNEVMMEMAGIHSGEEILDAGCGVGGSSIFLARSGCRATGITLSARQVKQSKSNAEKAGVDEQCKFLQLDYSNTKLPGESFDIVWGCESICYADDKELFIRESFRLLKPGGRLIVADGFVTSFENNDNRIIRQWLDGWQVNYLESPERFQTFMKQAGFKDIRYNDISRYTIASSKRLYRFYYLAKLYLLWKTISFSNKSTEFQRKNINACKYQYKGMKNRLWQYGMVVGQKPGF